MRVKSARRVRFRPITAVAPVQAARVPTSSPVAPVTASVARVVVRGAIHRAGPRALLRKIRKHTGAEDIVSVREIAGRGSRLLVVGVRGKPNLMAMKRLVQRAKKTERSPDELSVKWYEDARADGDLEARRVGEDALVPRAMFEKYARLLAEDINHPRDIQALHPEFTDEVLGYLDAAKYRELEALYARGRVVLRE